MNKIVLKLTDVHGKELNFGDIVKINSGRGVNSCFYAEVKYLEKEQAIAPFHTFSFHSFEKVDKLPEGAKELNEERYKCWFHTDEKEADRQQEIKESFDGYLIDWRKCEHELNRCFHIVIE